MTQGGSKGPHCPRQLAPAPALGPPGQRQVSNRDGVQHHPHPPGTAGNQRQAASGGDPAEPGHRCPAADPAWPEEGTHQTPRSPGSGRPGLHLEGRPTTTSGPALQRSLHGVGEVFSPRHQQQGHGGHRGLPEAPDRSSRDCPGGTTTTREKPATPSTPAMPALSPSPGLPVATGACPAHQRRAPNRLDH